jgi:serine/threonine protein kinase
MGTASRTCSSCETALPDDAAFCVKCGTPTPADVRGRAEGAPEEAELERLTEALANRYRIGGVLGHGGMATVYLAQDLRHERQVALKVLRPDLAAVVGPERFLREIRIAANLQHPHILPLYDSGAADEFLFYVMPFVEGESLRDRLNREQQLPIEDALRITREVAEGLGYAHGEGVVHRDIKPENILLHHDKAVIADFGIATAVSEAGGRKLTQTGLAVGTPLYMSPEQASGVGKLDGRSDIYSLACVLFEMLSGDPPFTASSSQALMARHAMDPVPSVRTVRSTVPECVDSAINKSLAKHPADRFSTWIQFTNALAGERIPEEGLDTGRGSADTGGVGRDLGVRIACSQLSTKNDICHATFCTSDRIVNAISDVARGIPHDSDEVFFVNQGAGEITVIFEVDREALFEGILSEALELRKKAAVMRIRESRTEAVRPGIDVPGLYAYFITRLAENGINLLDIVSTRAQLTLVIDEEDLTRAYTILSGSIRHYRSEHIV